MSLPTIIYPPSNLTFDSMHSLSRHKSQRRAKRKRTRLGQSCVVIAPSADLVVDVPPPWAQGVFFVLHELAELCTLPRLFYTRPSRLLHTRLQALRACASTSPQCDASRPPSQWRALHEAVVLVHAFCLCLHARHPIQSHSGAQLVVCYMRNECVFSIRN